MTTVTCKVENCPYFYQGLCSKPVANIDAMGMCGHIWKGGRQLRDAFNPVDESLKRIPAIEEGEYYEQSSKEEELQEREEGGNASVGADDGARDNGENDCGSDGEFEGGNEE